MSHQLGILLGDDIGLEVVPEAVKVAKAALTAAGAGGDVEWTELPIGRAALEELGTTMPDDTLDRLAALDGWILGPIGHQAYRHLGEGAFNPHPIIRKHFEMFANLRPAISYTEVPSLHKDVDVMMVRDNHEGLQPDRSMFKGWGEMMPSPDMAISVRLITRQNTERLARVGCELAMQRRRHVTIVHKDTVSPMTCGLFAEACRDVAKDYPEITFDEVIVDTFALKAVMDPQQFDVVVISNMFGDIMSDLVAGLVGGLGLAPALQQGDKYAMAQAAHGSAPDIAGQGIADPYAEVMSMQMLLAWLGGTRGDAAVSRAADAIENAVKAVIAEKKVLTPDLGGDASTSAMGDAIAEKARVLAAAG
jgi:3-isopropylmalate dehydrogenase